MTVPSSSFWYTINKKTKKVYIKLYPGYGKQTIFRMSVYIIIPSVVMIVRKVLILLQWNYVHKMCTQYQFLLLQNNIQYKAESTAAILLEDGTSNRKIVYSWEYRWNSNTDHIRAKMVGVGKQLVKQLKNVLFIDTKTNQSQTLPLIGLLELFIY